MSSTYRLYVDSMVRISKGYLDLNPGLLDRLKYDYTFVNKNTEEELELWEYDEHKEEYSFPRSAENQLRGETCEDYRELGISMKFSAEESCFSPREGQANSVCRLVEYLKLHKGGNLLADCGTGKTFMGTEIAIRLQTHTCVLVHKEFLARQWISAFESVAPGLKVGLLQRDTCEYGKDFDVTVAMVQSITAPKRKYPPDFYNSFGLLICDEVHRYGADVWHQAIEKFPALYRLGLTATFRRGDGLLGVITSHIGDIAHTHTAKAMKPVVYMRRLSTSIPESSYKYPWNKGGSLEQGERARMITALAIMESRSEVICKQILRALKANRKVFVLAERLSLLRWISKRCQAQQFSKRDIGFYIGGRKEKDLREAASRQLILATWQMAREGLDIPDLDTLFMATPLADVEQGIGRILRPEEGKKQPMVIDFVDMGVGPCVGMSKARRKMYARLGYEIHR